MYASVCIALLWLFLKYSLNRTFLLIWVTWWWGKLYSMRNFFFVSHVRPCTSISRRQTFIFDVFLIFLLYSPNISYAKVCPIGLSSAVLFDIINHYCLVDLAISYVLCHFLSDSPILQVSWRRTKLACRVGSSLNIIRVHQECGISLLVFTIHCVTTIAMCIVQCKYLAIGG